MDTVTLPREGPALLQGLILCGRCGQRMTVRYHHTIAGLIPSYVCQRVGIATATPICTVLPGHTLDTRIGVLLIQELSPLSIEAAFTVTAELAHRAEQADALRAAHVARARYHAENARRRYLAVDPANRLVADTLEADWNTALRALRDAQLAYDKARQTGAGQLTDAQKRRIGQLADDLPAIWNDPATPARERKRIARLLLSDVTVTRTRDTITAHARLTGGQHHTLTLPVPKNAAQHAAPIRRHRHRDRPAPGPPHPRRDRRHPQRPRPHQRRTTTVPRPDHPQHPRHLPAAPPRGPAPRSRPRPAPADGRPARRVHLDRQELVPRRSCRWAAL